MPFNLDTETFFWVIAVICFGSLAVSMIFPGRRANNTAAILLSSVALLSKFLLSVQLLFGSVENNFDTVRILSLSLVLPTLFIASVCFDYLAIARVVSNNRSTRAMSLLILIILTSVLYASVTLNNSDTYRVLIMIMVVIMLIFTGLTARTVLKYDASNKAINLSLLFFLVALFLMSAAYLLVFAVPTMSELATTTTSSIYISIFFILVVVESLFLVIFIKEKIWSEKWNNLSLGYEMDILSLEQFEQSAVDIRYRCGRLDQAVSLAIIELSDCSPHGQTRPYCLINQVRDDFIKVAKFCLRKYDRLALLENNYFLILLPFTNLEHAEQACDRLRKQMAVELFVEDEGARFPVLLRIGITNLPRSEVDVSDAILRASKALNQTGMNETGIYSME